MSYDIVRHYMQPKDGRFKRVIRTRLTLEEAQEHCRDPETSSKTATGSKARERTRKHGPWFDGYEER